MSFLFIHIPKCGGTSISQVVMPNRVQLCQGKNGYFWVDNGYPQPTIDMIITGCVGDKRIAPSDNLSSYDYIFSVVRNPWDRALSWYHWHINDMNTTDKNKSHFSWYKQFESFSDWVKKGMSTPHISPFNMMEWIKYGGNPDLVCKRINKRRTSCPKRGYLYGGLSEIIPDSIYKMEDLFNVEKDNWSLLMEKCGLDPQTKRKHLNSSGKRKNMKQYYTIETAQIVYDKCKEDIEFFNYKFF
jgi:hypothetical protein